MYLSRREFLKMLAAGAAVGLWTPGSSTAKSAIAGSTSILSSDNASDVYDFQPFGNVSLIHFTDSHAQLLPSFYREPNIHLGIGKEMEGEVPHVVGRDFLKRYGIDNKSIDAYALTFLDFPEMAQKYGRTGGFAHIATLIKYIRSTRPNSLLLDGGDTWQGSATALWTNAQDMVDASLLLGVDIMTGHWEFTYGVDRLRHVLENDFKDKIEFVAQNVTDLEFEDLVFKPYTIREVNNTKVAVIGQAFPYTPIANPRHLISNWQFGISEVRLQEHVDKARAAGAQVVVLLSHNGMDIDLKLAKRVRGIDAILGGHTHDAVPAAVEIRNPGGVTLVMNSGTNGKFVSLLDLYVKNGRIRDYKYKLIPVFSNMINPDPAMMAHIDKVREPFLDKLDRKIAVTDGLLYRRGTFNGTFDQIIVDALLERMDGEVAFSPGFRWGTTVLPNTYITYEDVMSQTAITYPEVRVTEVTGAQLKEFLEDIADNRFSPDPYLQQGGDMVRVGGLRYTINPKATINHRIEDMELNGKKILASKKYKLVSWASVQEPKPGPKIWDVVVEHLRDKRIVRTSELNVPKIKNVENNPGIYLG